jgi:hypothetical protein
MRSPYRRNEENPTDSWIAPEHGRMSQGMRRYRRGIRDDEGLWLVRPGERVLPEPSVLRQQRESEHRLTRRPGCKCDICMHDARVMAANSGWQDGTGNVV